ncbi:MAG TPA: RNA methyltransferase [Flavisolibacter sp.]|nr:RNA methyltransferase [Flavisolibacter sp.]
MRRFKAPGRRKDNKWKNRLTAFPAKEKRMRKLSMDELGRKTVEEFRQSEKIPVIVVLENIRSAYNVGSVFRTADAFLLESIYICGYTAFPPHKEIKKTALGAEESVAWKHFKNIGEAIEEIRAQGFKVYAVEQAVDSWKLGSFSTEEDKIAVILGNEVTGVEQSTIALCDGVIEIPQLGMKHSLNVATAAGVVLWELVRTRIKFV